MDGGAFHLKVLFSGRMLMRHAIKLQAVIPFSRLAHFSFGKISNHNRRTAWDVIIAAFDLFGFRT